MADRVVIMSKGKIEQVGAPREVYRRPASRFVAEFVGSNNIIKGMILAASDQTVEVETAIGRVTASLPGTLALEVGSNVELVISADTLHLSTDNPGDKNTVRCNVVSEEFIGTVVTLLVETGEGVELKIQKQQREVDQFDLVSDTALWASWSPDDVYILP